MLAKLKRPEVWVAILIVLGALGGFGLAVGKATHTGWLYWVGLGLCIPGVLVVVLLVVVVFPILIWANHRARKKQTGKEHRS